MPTEISRELPRLVSEMHIARFEQGRADDMECFLVETHAGAFLVNQKMRCLLEALVEQSSLTGVRAHLEESLGKRVDAAEVFAAIAGLPESVFQEGRATAQKTPFHFSMRLLPAWLVQALAARARYLYSPVAVAFILGIAALELPWLVQGLRHSLDAPLDPVALGLLIAGAGLIALVHELGHAAACAWFGLPPGEIGFGLYLIFPVFYTDVTKAWRLSPPRRAAVDAGGMYFQIILISVAIPLAHRFDNDPRVFAFVLYNLYLVFHNLNPLFKMDGYWIFSDLAGLPNLHKRTWQIFREVLGPGPKPSGGFRWTKNKNTWLLLHGYAFAVAAYGVFALIALPQWFATQLRPYPSLATVHLRAIAAYGHAADYGRLAAECGRLALASLMPALVLALLVSLVARSVRPLFARRKAT